jgi:hypothetical protein
MTATDLAGLKIAWILGVPLVGVCSENALDRISGGPRIGRDA